MFQGTVPDLAALRAIGPSVRIPGLPIFVLDLGVAGDRGDYYLFFPSLTLDPITPLIVEPDAGTGRWVRQGRLVHYSSDLPSGAPPMAGITWVASRSSPVRTVRFLSVGVGSSADWVPYANTIVSSAGTPSGVITPDFIGQEVYDSVGLVQYYATSLTSSGWQSIS